MRKYPVATALLLAIFALMPLFALSRFIRIGDHFSDWIGLEFNLSYAASRNAVRLGLVVLLDLGVFVLTYLLLQRRPKV